ncbi:hypothetical protein SBRCBS47491_008342 [Sporothrix bragantina]|uniref:Pentatricopeptide repeat protein n=1 Tax=Sporothrix bragantina TaxID=671064 RepID=A0ABP0CLA4_9PEZI
MTGTRIVVDGLWRCLCPSVDATALLRAVNGGAGTARPTLQHASRIVRPARAAHILARRPRSGCIATSAGSAAVASAPVSGQGNSSRTASFPHGSTGIRFIHGNATARVGRLGFTASSTNESRDPSANRASPADQQQLMQLAVHSLLRARPPFQRELAAASTSAIYEALRELQDKPQAFNRIQAFARYLLDERREAPTAALYEALVRSNCHVNGSADAVQDLLRVLQEGRIEGTPSLFQGALSVLAVHPDYILRNAVLQEMKDRWIELALVGQVSVALGLLRDGQYERALNLLDDMTEAASHEGAEPVPSWLLDIYVYVLGQEGFLDDALQIVNHRLLRKGDSVSLNVWSFLLDACCRRGHFGGLVYVWNRVVRPNGGNGLITPSDAMALDVLNMAAQNGDANLAAKIMKMLSARGTKLSMPHFEAMLDCYAQAGAIDKALQALCIMHNAGIVPDQGSTRPIYLGLINAATALQDSKNKTSAKDAVTAAIESAVTALFSLKKQYGSVPIAAFNVVLEAMLASRQQAVAAVAATSARSRKVRASAEADGETDAEAALDLYRHVRQLCPAGPSRATFRLLFRACTEPMHLNFLIREMSSFSFRPDMDMIDQVVYENATHGSLDQALQYVFDLMGEGEGSRRTSHVEDIKEGSGASEATNEAHAESLRRQPWISRRTAASLAKRCIEEEDERIWVVADASRDRGRPMDTILREAAGGATRRPRPAANAYGVPHAIDIGEDESPTLEETNLS